MSILRLVFDTSSVNGGFSFPNSETGFQARVHLHPVNWVPPRGITTSF